MARGHVRQRPNGRWAAVIELPRDRDGKRRQQWITCDSKSEAERALATRLVELDRGVAVDPVNQTLRQYADDFLARNDLYPSTRQRYERALRQQVYPWLGEKKLGRLTPEDVQRWQRAASAKYAPTTVNVAQRILSRVLNQAVEFGHLARNPCTVVDNVRYERRTQVDPWTAGEAAAFLAALDDPQQLALFRLLLTTGMRIGEACALAWADLDEASATLRVERTITEAAGRQRVVGERAKTEAGRRAIDLDEGTLSALRAWRAEQKLRRLAAWTWHDTGLIFTGRDGRRLDHNTTHYWLRKGCERSGVRKVRTHDLRHTYATLALRAGTPIVVVSRRLGHASPDVTWKLYQHHLSGEGRDAADQIARVLAG